MTQEQPQEPTGFHHVQNRAVPTQKLIERLQHGVPGDILTDEELTEIAGYDTRPSSQGRPGKGYSYLTSAIRYVLNNHAVVWDRVRGGNYIRCVDDPDKLPLAASGLNRVRKAARKSARVLGTINIENLTAEQVQERNANLAITGAICQFADRKTMKALSVRNVQSTPKIDTQSVIDLFKKQ